MKDFHNEVIISFKTKEKRDTFLDWFANGGDDCFYDHCCNIGEDPMREYAVFNNVIREIDNEE